MILLGVLRSIAEWFYAFGTALGGPGLLLIAIADSSFLSIPEGNDLLIVVLSLGKSWTTMAYLVSMTIIGSVLGCLLLFWVGRRGGRALLDRKFSPAKVQLAENYVQRYGVFSVMIPSILPPPMPFKIFVLTAGVFHLSLGRFLAAVIIGRSIRYFTWGFLSIIYGERVKEFILDNLPRLGSMLLGVFVLLVVLIVVWQVFKRQKP